MTDDLISRQAALKHFKKRLYETAMNNLDLAGVFTEMADHRVETWIDELPTAEPMTGLYVVGFNDGYKAGKEDAEKAWNRRASDEHTDKGHGDAREL